MENKNKSFYELIRPTLVLFAITLITGLLLGGVYELTAGARAKQEEKKVNDAYARVMPAAGYNEITPDEAELFEKFAEYDITEKNVSVDGISEAYNAAGETLGYVISVTDKDGYGGDISLCVGIDAQHRITGISILDISETAGLGMKAKEESFLSQYLKETTDIFSMDEIDAISGATITTKAVTAGINAAVITADAYLGDGGESDESAD